MEWFLLIILILAMVLTDIGALGLLIWVVEHDFEPAVKVEGIGVSVKDGVVTLNGSVGRHAEKVDPKEVTLESIPESERWNPMPGPEGHKMPEAANRWSNVYIEDVAELYRLALEKAPAGSFYFVENGEASYAEIGAAIARRLGLGPVQSWTVEEATCEWGEGHARYSFGSNSRVRARRARIELGWSPKHASLVDWIEHEMPIPPDAVPTPASTESMLA